MAKIIVGRVPIRWSGDSFCMKAIDFVSGQCAATPTEKRLGSAGYGPGKAEGTACNVLIESDSGLTVIVVPSILGYMVSQFPLVAAMPLIAVRSTAAWWLYSLLWQAVILKNIQT